MGSTIQLTAADGTQVPAYVATPAAPAKAAVLVIQEIFGVNAHIREVADAYASEGFLTIAPAMFQRVQAQVELGYAEADMGAGMGGGKVGIVGYCWGGLLTWRSACLLNGLSAAAPYYGGGMTTEAESARQAKVPVMAHFAEEDKWISMESVAAFQKAQPAAQVFTYPAHHGFNCNHRGTWQAEAAALAKQRSLAFFKMHLLGNAH